jgi:hypothetical protein
MKWYQAVRIVEEVYTLYENTTVLRYTTLCILYKIMPQSELVHNMWYVSHYEMQALCKTFFAT